MTDHTEADRITLDSDASTGGGIGRRTILTGAAWTIPAVLVTQATPAFAASGLVLSFSQASYSSTACAPITGVVISAATNGAAAAGASVTALLSDGYTFAGGGTSFTGTTDSSGSLALPSITVPASAVSSTITATSSTAQATAAVSTTAASSAVYAAAFTATGLGSVPLAAKKLDDGRYQAFVLGSDGRAYGCVRASDADGAAWESSWAATSMTGVKLMAMSNWGQVTVLSDGASVMTAGGVALPALPSGVSVKALDAKKLDDGRYQAFVLGSDGRAYGCVRASDADGAAWESSWAATSMTGVKLMAMSNWGQVTVLSDGASVMTAGGVALPALPSGVSVKALDAKKLDDGRYQAFVLGSDGRAYGCVRASDADGAAWESSWAATSMTGVKLMAMSNWGQVTVLSDGASVMTAGGVALPALPSGVSVKALDAKKLDDGRYQAFVLGSDGRAYGCVRASDADGAAWESSWAATSMTGVKLMAMSNWGQVTVLSDGASVMTAGGVALPALPSGVTLMSAGADSTVALPALATGVAANQIAAKKLDDGRYQAFVLGSDGRAYGCVRASDADGAAWESSWAATSMTGVKLMAMSNWGQVTVLSDGASVMTAGGVALPALPSGVSVKALDAKKLDDGRYQAFVLGSDGRAYACTRDAVNTTVWESSWTATSMTGVKLMAMSNWGQVTVLSDGASVMTAGGVALPALPSGVSVKALDAKKLDDGRYQAFVLGSDGRAYGCVRASDADGAAWESSWAATSMTGVKLMAMSNWGQVTVLSDGASVMTAGGVALPALPSGVSVKALDAKKLDDGRYQAFVLGSDGRAYGCVRASDADGAAWESSWAATSMTGVKLMAMSNYGQVTVLSTGGC
ncbi:hypothetical protein QE410_000409 [Microbacterium sp. SORGH_AS 1204]|uniref:hypothetical protein n=1 Tax=Microbacterium sp. SORGH_AS_1204 TaxID=3041785 RepID=UPI00279253F0|nr:hypothetical protein [Microbacterium sp. SORGH_AS_1204]MDQ1135610.1 hypothetical protein [Microbacterium sp. SORGH_AS_1204]